VRPRIAQFCRIDDWMRELGQFVLLFSLLLSFTHDSNSLPILFELGKIEFAPFLLYLLSFWSFDRGQQPLNHTDRWPYMTFI